MEKGKTMKRTSKPYFCDKAGRERNFAQDHQFILHASVSLLCAVIKIDYSRLLVLFSSCLAVVKNCGCLFNAFIADCRILCGLCRFLHTWEIRRNADYMSLRNKSLHAHFTVVQPLVPQGKFIRGDVFWEMHDAVRTIPNFTVCWCAEESVLFGKLQTSWLHECWGPHTLTNTSTTKIRKTKCYLLALQLCHVPSQ